MTGVDVGRRRRRSAVDCEVEAALFAEGALVVAGMDEVGRGAWAGPVTVGVVALAAALPEPPEGLDDSKRLSPGRRRSLLGPIRAWAKASALGWASAAEIDRGGLAAALGAAGVRALFALGIDPDVVVLDGAHDWLTPRLVEARQPGTVPSVVTLVSADRRVASVAAASVVAKVARDEWMVALEARWPGFGFAAHKGYGTLEHQRALERLGPTPEHRRSWAIPGVGPASLPTGATSARALP